MRVPPAAAARPPRPASPGRAPIITVGIVLLFVITSLRGVAGFWTDYLWFDQLGYGEVWSGVLGAKALLVAAFTGLFFAGMWTSLRVADELAPRFRSVGPEAELVLRYREAVGPYAGRLRTAVSLLFAVVAGTGVSGQWESWLKFRNATPFGVEDPMIGRDVGFFVFRLPFLSFVVDWLFVAIVIVLVVTVAAHYLNGAIVVGPGVRATPAVRSHLSVLLGLLALVKAADYWLQRFELSYSTFADGQIGAGYTDVNARLPAVQLLLLISLTAAVLLFANVRMRSWVLAAIAVGLWVLVKVAVGGIYPAIVQSVRVQPNEAELERPFLERNIEATQAAFGLSDVEERPFAGQGDISAEDLAGAEETIRNVRLWDPRHTKDTFQQVQGLRSFYELADLDIDRYEIDGRTTQVVVSVRELEQSELSNQSWVNVHLKYTHGYGAIVAPANAVSRAGQPVFSLEDIPPQGEPAVEQPRVYFGERGGEYAIVRTAEDEIDYVRADGRTEPSRYAGRGGVGLANTLRRVAFGLRFGDPNIVISKAITDESRVLYIRRVADRVRTAAPFLRYDADPYPVILDGRIVWIQDAYTVSSRYPYAQYTDGGMVPAGSGLAGSFNYVRNSVKVMVDAFDGSMRFFVVDEEDPIIQTYRKAFPSLFESADRMPEGLREHLRYPEDLFRVQSNLYGRYHITDPADFFNASDAWEVSPDPGSGEVQRSSDADTETTTGAPGGRPGGPLGAAGLVVRDVRERMDPAYLLMRLPGEEDSSFVLLQAFVPRSARGSRQNLTSFLVAKSDPGEYGKLISYPVPGGEQVDGPSQVASFILQEPIVSQQITLLSQGGSKVILGNILLLPIEDSILYVRPLYVTGVQTRLPELKQVVVVADDRVVARPTLAEALTELFGTAPATLEEGVDGGGDAGPEDGSGSGGPGGPSGAPPADVQALLDQALAAFTEADAALKAGDLATYQRKVEEARRLAQQARERSAAGSAGGSGSGGSSGGSAPTSTTAPAASSA